MTSYEAHFFVKGATEQRRGCGNAPLFDRLLATYFSALEFQKCGADPSVILETESRRLMETGKIGSGQLDTARQIAVDIMKLGESYPVQNDLDRAKGLYERANHVEIGE